MRDAGQFRVHRRSHEERVAPPPQRLRRVIWDCNLLIDPFTRRLEHGRVVKPIIQLQIGLSDGLIVRMHDARPWLETELTAKSEHDGLIPITCDRCWHRQQTRVQRSVSPVRLRHGWQTCDLPIGDLAHGGANCDPVHRRRQLRRQRSSYRRCVPCGFRVGLAEGSREGERKQEQAPEEKAAVQPIESLNR